MIDKCSRCGSTGQIDIIKYSDTTIAKCKNCGASVIVSCKHRYLSVCIVVEEDTGKITNSAVCTVCGHHQIENKMEDECHVKTNSSALSHQVGGVHYKSYKIQPYEFFIANQIPHHKSAIIRRILRYDHPTGKGKEDLMKIKHEIDLILELDPIFKEEK